MNGPIVAFLAGPFAPGGGRHDGILGEGTITAANLTGPLAGMPLAVLVAAMRVGGTYANVHANGGAARGNAGRGVSAPARPVATFGPKGPSRRRQTATACDEVCWRVRAAPASGPAVLGRVGRRNAFC